MLSDKTALKLIEALEGLSTQMKVFNESMPYFQKQMGKVEAVQEAKRIEQTGKELLNQNIEAIFNRSKEDEENSLTPKTNK